MHKLKSGRNRLSGLIRAELCRVDLRCVIVGAVIVLLCGALSALAAGPTVSYYELTKPRFAPPRFLFPIVWTILYALIGGAAGAIACVKERALEADKYKGLLFFIIMMIFNFIWAPLFFGACAFFAAFCAIVMMIILTICVIRFFRRVLRIAGAVMVIYFIWLIFAAFLNLAIIILN